MNPPPKHVFAFLLIAGQTTIAEPVEISGIYPSLAMFNQEGECGTGAVVPWGDRLWVITYGPHLPKGSSDKLYEISPDLQQTIRPESLGGTPANRMIHEESKQLFIGPHAIREDGEVRTVPYSDMVGRHTGNARHLKDPENKIYYATMEEGIYEVDVRTLESKVLWADDQKQTGHPPKGYKLAAAENRARLPGYHGKGLYSGQGVLVYANNGEPSAAAKKRPDVPSGVLAEWDGKSDGWTIVRRNQFTEVTGPGGIRGNKNPKSDPIWSVGWDHRSLLLGVRTPELGWTFYRLPKGSHSYDGAHGWNTEWPRIRDIGEDSLLMTMHGTFWKFPKTFTPKNSAGISPRSNYLKVIGDFCRWNDRIVLGCDDTAKLEFLNKRKAKGHIAAPQSQSNLWFIEPERLDDLGPVIGRGMVWTNEDVAAGRPSDPYLFSGYDHRMLHLSHKGALAQKVLLEVDQNGDGQWKPLRTISLPPRSYVAVVFTPDEQGAWIRLTAPNGLKNATASFSYRNPDERAEKSDTIFAGIAKPGDKLTGGLVRARGGNEKTLAFAAVDNGGKDIGYYELTGDLKLVATDNNDSWRFTKENTSIPSNIIKVDEASVLYIDDSGNRWRLPKGDAGLDKHPLGSSRICREVATERDLFNAHGSFYELPARNAGGFIKVRPVATHNRQIHDYCSYRGLFVISGISTGTASDNRHIIKSDDGKAAIWAGAIDDVWKLGKPRGKGGPWMKTEVKANEPSDPYLMTAYDQKILSLSFEDSKHRNLDVTMQVDVSGDGDWRVHKVFQLEKGQVLSYQFEEGFSAYWVRFSCSENSTVTAQLEYR